MVSSRLYWVLRGFIDRELSLFPLARLVWPVTSVPWPHSFDSEATVAMARALEQIVRRDRLWFQAHAERWHFCRWPDRNELDFCDSDPDARLIIAIRHLGRGRIVYQPVIFEGAPPADERSAAALFALAARNPEPIPVVTEMGLLRLRRSGALSQRITAAAASSSSSSSGVALPHAH
jgi:hypothetical protein